MVKIASSKVEFDTALKDAGNKLVAVDFTATWCPPCRMIGPIFEELSTQHTDVVFLKVDVDENTETAQDCGIKCMPTFQFYKNGKMIHEFSGASEDKLRAAIEEHK